MSIDYTHPWIYDMDEAARIQENLNKRVSLDWDGRPVKTIAGIDVAYAGVTIRAAISVLCYPELTRVATVTGEALQAFPYIPGLLAFRVGPAILEAWEKLKVMPDLVLIHGQGIAHPRHFGLASHIGLWLNIPTIGVAKTRLYGNHSEVGPQVGDWSEIVDEHASQLVIGAVLRTQPITRPVYVSPGHLIDLLHSIEFVLGSCSNYRMPEPLRKARTAVAGSSQLAKLAAD